MSVGWAIAWNEYMIENRQAALAYQQNPLALSDWCDADDRRIKAQRKTIEWQQRRRKQVTP